MWEITLSIFTIVLSCIAILISIFQNIVTKKQNLFDRRLRLYLEINDLMKLYKNNELFIKNTNPISVEMEFSFLTNSSKLYMLADIMDDPLNQTKKVAFLTVCESMRKDAQEFRFVFKNKKYLKCTEFIEAYVEMLQQFHRQQILIKHIDKQNEELIKRKLEPQKLQDVEKECEEFANDGLFPIIKKIQQIYKDIKKEKLLEKLEKEIKF